MIKSQILDLCIMSQNYTQNFVQKNKAARKGGRKEKYMKLNPDCVRDILLTVEETTTLETQCYINQDYKNFKRLAKYDFSVLSYHVHQCALYDYFTFSEFDEKWNCRIEDLSPKGHEFISHIRDNTIWAKIKKVAASIGIVSLQTLAQIATTEGQAQITGMLT